VASLAETPTKEAYGLADQSMVQWKEHCRLPISNDKLFPYLSRLQYEICQNQRFLKGLVTLSANFT